MQSGVGSVPTLVQVQAQVEDLNSGVERLVPKGGSKFGYGLRRVSSAFRLFLQMLEGIMNEELVLELEIQLEPEMEMETEPEEGRWVQVTAGLGIYTSPVAREIPVSDGS